MMPDMKNRLDLINSKLDTAEERISKLDNIVIGTIQNAGVGGTERKNKQHQ